MKAFKIKKKSHRQPVFIIGPPITSFPKPNIPRLFVAKIHPPTLYKPQLTFAVERQEQPEQHPAHQELALQPLEAALRSLRLEV